jgi:purine nucleosidase
MRLIIDVDTGVDDALALAFAVRHPEISLEAVLTVCGNVSLDRVADNTLRVLDWLGATDVPVLRGLDRPLVGPPVGASHWHGEDGLGGADLPASRRSASEDAVAYLIERLTGERGELTLVCTGPLTNLAVAITREPGIVACARAVCVMGGTIHPPGNVTPVAEFNVYADPEAAAIVFAQSWPLTLVGLDVTRQTLLTRADLNDLATADSAEAILVRQTTCSLFDRPGVQAVALHDPLAVAVALDPSLVTSVSGPVQVETRGELTRGQTIVDLRRRQASATQVCMEVAADRFRRHFFETLGLA